MKKPDWKDAPEWVMWIGQDKDGVWFGYSLQPDKLNEEWGCSDAGFFNREGSSILLDREDANDKWYETLEARPSC